MMRLSCLNRKIGFTLVEVMVGMAILSLSLLASYGLVNHVIRMIRPSRESTLSMQAAQIEMEQLRMSWETFDSLGSRTAVSGANNPALSELDNGQIVVHKAPYDGVISNVPVYSVSVEVSWEQQNGLRATNVLVGVIGRNGIVR